MTDGTQVYLTLDEAAQILDPPMSRDKLRALIEATGLPPRGTRRKRGPGRPALTYDAAELMQLHAANIPFIYQYAVTGAP